MPFRLCNNDISDIVAQTASCLKRKDFIKTLNIVQSVLNESSSRDKDSSSTLTYESIGRMYKIRVASNMAAWTAQVEGMLMSSAKQGRYDPQSALVKCAVFFWICTRLKVSTIMNVGYRSN